TTTRLQASFRGDLERAAEGRQDCHSYRAAPCDRIRLEAKREPRHERLEGEQCATETHRPVLAIAGDRHTPSSSAVQPKAELPARIQPGHEETRSAAAGEQRMIARRCGRRVF